MDIIFTKPSKKIAKRQLELRDRLWPGLNKQWLWHRKERNGFTTIPRAISLIAAIIDDLTPGAPASAVYLDLWTRAYDESFVVLAKSREMAFHSGFTGQRSERTWKQRIRALADLGFIDLKGGQSGPLSYALIKNPYLVIKALREQGHQGVTSERYNALVERCLEIGETSLDDAVPTQLEGLAPPQPPVSPTPSTPPLAAPPQPSGAEPETPTAEAVPVEGATQIPPEASQGDQQSGATAALPAWP